MRNDFTYVNPADKTFKINEIVDLRLIDNKTYIFINNQPFIQCLNVLMNIGADESEGDETIRTMDDASRVYKGRYAQWFARLSPEEEFMAHCSNIQAFFENNLNTDLLHSDIAFPLLRKLVKLGYKPAVEVFKDEIFKRYNAGTLESRKFLSLQGYLKYLDEE